MPFDAGRKCGVAGELRPLKVAKHETSSAVWMTLLQHC